MNILVVSQYFWPENFRVNDLVDELVKRGHSVFVLTGTPNYPEGVVFPEYKDNPSDYNDYCGAKIIRVPVAPRGTGSAFRLLLNYVSFIFSGSILGAWKLRGQNIDKIFVYEPSPITVCLPAILLKKIKKAPIVFWVLDLWPETLVAVGVLKSRFLTKIVGVLVSYIYKHCDLILTQSRAFIQNITLYCNTPEKIKYFPSWAEDSFSQPQKLPIMLTNEIPESTSNDIFSIMFAGNIGEAQDFPAILKAAEILKTNSNIRWLIVGDGRMFNWVKQECMVRGLSNNVLLLGRHSLEKMPSFYKKADALIVSLKNEMIFDMTIPGKVQSYLASGRPILGMLNGEGAKVLRDSNSGFVCNSGDASGLAHIVEKMVALPHKDRVCMGDSGRNYYLKEFDRNILIDRLEKWLIHVA